MLNIKDIGEWETVVYDLKIQDGTQTNIRAQFNKYDTWVELHGSISKPRPSSEMRKILYDFIKSIKNTVDKGDLVDGSRDEMLKDFAFLISKVRGAVRYYLEKDKECFPWVSLAIDPNDREAIGEFRFTPEMVAEVGDVSAKTFGKIFALITNIESCTLGAIGTCETDLSIKETKTPNVIALHLERRNGTAITLRFPFEQKK